MTQEEKEMLREVHSALVGNKEMGELGIAKKVDAMWAVFAGLTFLGKFATWTAVILTGIGAVWEATVHFLVKQVK